MVWLVFTTKETPIIENTSINLLYTSCSQQVEKLSLVGNPIAAMLLVSVEHLLCWRKLRIVKVVDATDFLCKVSQVCLLYTSDAADEL